MTEVAIVHDILAARAGGERVLLAIADLFPDAPVHTLLHEPSATFAQFAGREITTSVLQHSSWLRHNYRAALPTAVLAMASRRIEADVTICSTSGLSHHVRATGKKIVYCHTPARWLHDGDNYLMGYGRGVRTAASLLAPPMRFLDRRAMRSADLVLTNSTAVAAEVACIYGIDAEVVPPCSTLALEGPIEALPRVEPGFVLSPVRPLGYKRLDVLLDAARALPDRRFVHVGDGPHRAAFEAAAPANVVSFGNVSDAQLRWAYRNAAVVALTCAEDFGLVPLEACAHGVPTIAPAARGLLDHDRAALITYPHGDPAALAAAIRNPPPPTGILDPDQLGIARFRDRLRSAVETCP